MMMMMMMMRVSAVRSGGGCESHHRIESAAQVATWRKRERGRMASGKEGPEGNLHVRAMCPNQGSATQFGAEKMGKMSTRLEALQGSRKRHESKTLTTTIRLKVRCYSFYTFGVNEHTYTVEE